MDRDDLRFGDIVLYENGSITFVGRTLALMEKSSAINVVNYSSVAILDVLRRDTDSESQRYLATWDEWIANNGSSLAFEWGDTTKKFRSADVLVVAPLVFVKQLFDKADVKFFRDRGACPRCGDMGEWKSLALVCRWHGMYI